MFTEIDFGEDGYLATDEPEAHGGTGEGPSPLQSVIGALCGCESVTFKRTAAEYEFSYEGIVFEAEYTIDIRGRLGVEGVRPHFQTIRVDAVVTTAESEERLAEVVEETESPDTLTPRGAALSEPSYPGLLRYGNGLLPAAVTPAFFFRQFRIRVLSIMN